MGEKSNQPQKKYKAKVHWCVTRTQSKELPAGGERVFVVKYPGTVAQCWHNLLFWTGMLRAEDILKMNFTKTEKEILQMLNTQKEGNTCIVTD